MPHSTASRPRTRAHPGETDTQDQSPTHAQRLAAALARAACASAAAAFETRALAGRGGPAAAPFPVLSTHALARHGVGCARYSLQAGARVARCQAESKQRAMASPSRVGPLCQHHPSWCCSTRYPRGRPVNSLRRHSHATRDSRGTQCGSARSAFVSRMSTLPSDQPPRGLQWPPVGRQ